MKSQRIMNSLSLIVALLALIVAFGMGALSNARIQAQEEDADPVAPQTALGTAFTYQGYLKDGNLPATGPFDFRFILYDSQTGGFQLGSPIVRGLGVTEGQFSLPLDFGNVFNGQKLWLEIGVRPSGSADPYVTLTPRQEITAAPYAVYALNVPAHDHFGSEWIGSGSSGLILYNNAANSEYGIFSEVVSPNGHGVYGNATSTSGPANGVTGKTDSAVGAGGLFINTAGGNALYAVGDVSQVADADGLVKAAIFASVGGQSPTLHRYFNTIGGVSIAPCGGLPQFWTGCARLDVNFDISNRYWVAMSTGNGYAHCVPYVSGATEVLSCARYNSSGQLENGDIMVIVY